MVRKISAVFAVLAVLMFGAEVSAVPAPLASASTSDVSLVLPGGNVNATLAAGAFAGNDKGAQGTSLHNLNTLDVFNLGQTWTLIGSSDDANSGPFTNNPDAPTGDLLLDTPIPGPFVLSLKAANAYSLYYFESPVDAAQRLNFTTVGTATNPHGVGKDLSHASLFRAEGAPNTPNDPNNPNNPPQGQVGANPEPTTAMLGLIGIGALAMRRRKMA